MALFAASIVAAFAAWWTSNHDFVSLLERRIGAARGMLAPDALELLRDINLTGTLLICTGVLVSLGILAERFSRRSIQRILRAQSENMASISKPAPWPMTLISGLLVFARYHATLEHGFFRFDDFDFVSYARDYPLKDAIWMLHGDHFYPLTRILVSAAGFLFGVTAWPYNLGVLLCFWAVAALGCRLLDEWKVSMGGQGVFVVLFLFWSPWAEMLGGYYILSAYMLVAACGLGAILCYLRWCRVKRPSAAWGVALCTAAAVLIDTSGWYVPAAVAVFLAANFGTVRGTESLIAWCSRHRVILIGLAVAAGSCIVVTVLCYKVMNPGLFLSMSEGGHRSTGRLFADFLYLLDVGLLVSMAVPFVYARLPLVAIITLAVAAGVIFSALSTFVWRKADRRQKIALVAITLVIAGSALMVNLGRPSGETLLVRWSAKHVCPAYIWLCLLLAMKWQILWNCWPEKRRVTGCEVTAILLSGFCAAQVAFGSIGLAVSFPPFGFPAEIRDAIVRRQNVDALAQNVVQRVADNIEDSAVVPTLDGAYINARHPSLFDYNLVRYFAFFGPNARDIRFVRNSAMQPFSGPGVDTVPALRDAVSSDFLKLLQRDAKLRDYYFTPITLRLDSSGLASASQRPDSARDDAILLTSDGRTSLSVRDQPFDPEALPHLVVEIQKGQGTPHGEIKLGVFFQCDFDLAGPRGTIQLPAGGSGVNVVDLRQIYAFALSRRISDVRIEFFEPGNYRVRVAELSP